MNNKCIELHLHKFGEIRNNFLLELYMYLLKNKNCIYMVLNFPKGDFQSVDTGVFEEYICKNINKGSNSFFFDKGEYEAIGLANVEINDVMIKAIVEHFSYESLKRIQELGWDKMMLFKKCNFDDSIVIGVYDYQTYIVISNINNNDIIQIRKLLVKYIDDFTIGEITKDL